MYPLTFPSTSQQAILAPRDNSSVGNESGEGQVPSPAVESRPTSFKDEESDGQGQSGGDSTHDVFLYDGVGVGDGLDDLDGPLQKTEKHRQRYQAQFCTFNAKRANRQGSMIETNSGGVSDAPSGGGEDDSSLRSSNGGGASDFTNSTVESGNESTPTSPSSQDGGKATGGGREGVSVPPSPAPSYSTSTSNREEGVAQPNFSGRDRCNLE